MLPKIKDEVYIQSFKHDGSLHRTWVKGFVIESNEKQIVAVTNSSWVVEANGRKWITKEPAICFFYPNRWFNIIAMIRKQGIFYYCNIASPSIYDGEAIKNIDYDLDLKVYPNNSYIVLDEDEYRDHGKKMHYSEELKEVLERELRNLINEVDNKCEPFNEKTIYDYYDLYINLLNNKKM